MDQDHVQNVVTALKAKGFNKEAKYLWYVFEEFGFILKEAEDLAFDALESGEDHPVPENERGATWFANDGRDCCISPVSFGLPGTMKDATQLNTSAHRDKI